MTPAPIRIDVWRAGRALLLALILPMTIAVVVDLTMGTLPFAIIAAVVICIPLATILVSRTVLAEFDRVIAVVAPELPEAETPAETVAAEMMPAAATPAPELQQETTAPAAQGVGWEQGQDQSGDAEVSTPAR